MKVLHMQAASLEFKVSRDCSKRGIDAQLTCLLLFAQGKSLTAGVRQVHTDFQKAFGTLQKVEYDVLDLGGGDWAGDHGCFKVSLRELEKRLSQIIVLVRFYLGAEP